MALVLDKRRREEIRYPSQLGAPSSGSTDWFAAGHPVPATAGVEQQAFPIKHFLAESLGRTPSEWGGFGQTVDYDVEQQEWSRPIDHEARQARILLVANHWLGERRLDGHRAGVGSTLEALDRLKELDENWNGYGAIAIDPSTIEAAETFIRWLPDSLSVPPQVVPMTYGRLQLEWHDSHRSLELEFESATTVHYLKWDSLCGVEEEDVLPTTQKGQLLQLIRWITAGEAADV